MIGGILGLVILLVFIYVWCNPVRKRQTELGGYADRKAEVRALVMGLIFATLVLLICQIVLGAFLSGWGLMREYNSRMNFGEIRGIINRLREM